MEGRDGGQKLALGAIAAALVSDFVRRSSRAATASQGVEQATFAGGAAFFRSC